MNPAVFNSSSETGFHLRKCLHCNSCESATPPCMRDTDRRRFNIKNENRDTIRRINPQCYATTVRDKRVCFWQVFKRYFRCVIYTDNTVPMNLTAIPQIF